MKKPYLSSPAEFTPVLAFLLEAGKCRAKLEIREDRAFKPDSWLSLGSIQAFPSEDGYEENSYLFENAIRLGAYHWELPNFDELVTACETVFANTKNLNHDKTRRAIETLVHSALRCGFCWPIFDAASISDMPFRRPTTVIVDTSAILQGGLDFVVRNLYPMARIKVPAIVNMEILNQSDRYFKQRRTKEDKLNCPSAILDHFTSQAAQRVVLRLELHSNTEIERPRLGADPLRGIISNESDAEDKSLGLQVVQRSFADRLIIETAIHHRERLNSDHPIQLLTADQGLARMALSEGIEPLFFSSPNPNELCGKILLGTSFKPFVTSGSEPTCSFIPLTDLLWELACVCGSARLVTDDGKFYAEVSAMGGTLPWQPFHSKSDLLWVQSNAYKRETQVASTDASSGSILVESETDTELDTPETAPNDRPEHAPIRTALTGSYRFSVDSLIQTVLSFVSRAELSEQQMMNALQLSAKRVADVRNFLIAAGLVSRAGTKIKKNESMETLIQSLNTLDYPTMLSIFRRVPSFCAFLDSLQQGTPRAKDFPIAASAVPNYINLAEICCAALDIADIGVVLTPQSPAPKDFSSFAVKTYRSLQNGEDYVLTGRWLEDLALGYGIHPIQSRRRLNEAREAGHIERFTEGSTPETQFERHSMAILEREKERLVVRSMNLYHGDFLIPGKASVSIRLEEKKK